MSHLLVVGLVGSALLMLVLHRLWPRLHGYTGLAASGGKAGGLVRVRFELGDGLHEEGELRLVGVRSVKALRLALLQLADELLLDPEDDLGEWSLQYTNNAGGLLPVTASDTMDGLRAAATELRVTAGRALRGE